MLIASGTSAGAAAPSPTPTQIADLTATPTTVSYPDPVITVSGVLETTGPSPQPRPKTMLNVFYSLGVGGDAFNVKTDSSGRFSFPAPEVVPAPIVVSYAGDSQFGPTSQTANITGPVFPAKIVFDTITPVPAESTATVTGTLLMQLPDLSWVPSPDAPVSYVQQGSFRQTYTDQNGQFLVAVGAYPGRAVTVSTPASNGDFWWSGGYSAAPFYVPLTVDPTSVVNIGLDQTPSPAGSIGLNIHVVSADAAGTESQYSGPVQLFFQPASGGTWTLMDRTTTSDGFAHVTVSGYLAGGAFAAGNWKWVVPAEPGFGASGTQPFAVVISVPTKISGLKFARSGTKERLTGRLGYKTGAVPGAAVVIEHLSRGHWRNLVTVHTSSTGGFAYRFSRRLTGKYRVLYRGAALPGAEASFGRFESTLTGAVHFG
jgi:hypothetical protein